MWLVYQHLLATASDREHRAALRLLPCFGSLGLRESYIAGHMGGAQSACQTLKPAATGWVGEAGQGSVRRRIGIDMVDDKHFNGRILRLQAQPDLPDGIQEPDITRFGRIPHHKLRRGENLHVISSI